MNRRQFLSALGLLSLSGVGYAGLKFWPEQGLLNPCLDQLPDNIHSHPLMQKIWAGIKPEQVWDSHVHLVGTGDGATGIWFNPNMDSYWHPILKVQKSFYMNGSCAIDGDIDNSTVQRMLTQLEHMPGGVKLMLFAFDWFHDENGQPVRDKSIFHVPNSYAQKIASKHSHFIQSCLDHQATFAACGFTPSINQWLRLPFAWHLDAYLIKTTGKPPIADD